MMKKAGQSHRVGTGLMLLLSVSLLVSCKWNKSVTEYVYGKTPLVEIGTDVLYEEDIRQVLPLGLSDADSAAFARQFIRNWAQDVLFYQNAIRNIPDTKDIDRLVENYRRSLIEHEYQRRLIEQKFSSEISDEEVEQFFNDNQRLFILDESLVKGLFLKISNKSHDLSDIRKLYTRQDDESFEEIEKYSIRNAARCEFFYDNWRTVAEIEVLLPALDKPLESMLKEKMLCTEIGYTRLFYAHRPQKAVADMLAESRKNVYSQNAKGFMSRKRRDMGTSDRHGLCTLADRNHRDARPENIVRTGDAAVGMGRSRLRQVPVLHQGRLRTAYWKSYLTIILQRISQRARSVYEASTALSSLWSVCRRFLCRELRQKMVTLVGAAYTPISTKRTASRPAHGKDTCLRGASRSRVSRSLYQTISHISIIGYAASHSEKYQRDGFWQPTTGLAFRQLLSWNPFPYSIVQSVSQVVLPKGVSSYCTI